MIAIIILHTSGCWPRRADPESRRALLGMVRAMGTRMHTIAPPEAASCSPEVAARAASNGVGGCMAARWMALRRTQCGFGNNKSALRRWRWICHPMRMSQSTAIITTGRKVPARIDARSTGLVARMARDAATVFVADRRCSDTDFGEAG